MERDPDRVAYCKNVLLRNFMRVCDKRIAQGHNKSSMSVRVRNGVVTESCFFDSSDTLCDNILTGREVLDTVRGKYDHVDHTQFQDVMDITCRFNGSPIEDSGTCIETRCAGYLMGGVILFVSGTFILMA